MALRSGRGRSSRVVLSVSTLPSRQTSRSAGSPASAFRTMLVSFRELVTSSPSKRVRMSPTWTPARDAGLSSMTFEIMTPLPSGTPK